MTKAGQSAERFEEDAQDQFQRGLRQFKELAVSRLKVDKGAAKITFAVTIAEREDGDFDVKYETTVKLPEHKGDAGKARIENNQLVLL